MRPLPTTPGLRLLACLLLSLLCCPALVSAADLDDTLTRSVWRLLYGVSETQASDPAWLAADDDGDGQSNAAELAAGTNPFSAGSTLAVAATPADSANLALTFTSLAGKQYLVQATTTLGPSALWAPLTPSQAWLGDGKEHTFTVPKPAASTFYRLLVQDVDSDGDGVGDWAEKVAGFDPQSSHSRGAVQDDHAALTTALPAENIVTITATKADATQPPDAASLPTDTGTLTVTRSGTLRFAALTVPLQWTGTATQGVDYAAMPTLVKIPAKTSSVALTLLPMANPARQTEATATLQARPGAGYQVGAAGSASVVIAPAATPAGTGLTGTYYQSSSTQLKKAYDASLLFAPASQKLQRVDTVVDFTWTSPNQPTGLNAEYYTVRWTGQVQPQYSETYYFAAKMDDGVKLWIDGKLIIDSWVNSTAERFGSIPLRAGVKYDIRLEYYQYGAAAAAKLSWYSASQTKQVIPASRLYPDSATPAPPAFTSLPEAIGFVGQPFSFTLTASASGGTPPVFALGSGSTPLPPGLSLNGTSGQITGTPTTPGDYQVALTATNATGVGASVLRLRLLAPGNGVTRELWTNLAGPDLTQVPWQTAPASTDNALLTLEDTAPYGNNTGERLRGTFIAPATGTYYFWLAASNAAELWISNDAEEANLVRRARVAAPGTAPRAWATSGQTAQRSAWLALEAGHAYAYEVRHNTGSDGAGSHLAVGWLADPTGFATAPAPENGGLLPAHLLTRYTAPATLAANGPLYVTSLSPQGAALSSASGAADLRLNSSRTQAILHFSYGGLTSPRTAYHLHAAADATGSGPIVFDLDDIDTFHPELKTEDGGYIWNITATGALTAAQIVTALEQGYAYFNVHTVNFPNGEIRGNLRLVQGSQRPPLPVADPGLPNDFNTDAGASRFLQQASFGADPTDLAAVKSGGYSAWLESQFALPATHLLDDVNAHVLLNPNNPLDAPVVWNAWWRTAVTAKDQLRQRAAFAWSQILVVSASNATLDRHAESLASYYDTLADNAFGNFRDLLRAATLHPAMGYWLNMQGNSKGDLASGLHPNENYAREIMQLFSIGLKRLWPDGTLILDGQGNLIPTYDQPEIEGMARVFTGWTWNQALQTSGRLPLGFSPKADWLNPMVLVPTKHELGAKRLLNREVLRPAAGYNPPAAVTTGSEADSNTAAFDAYGQADLERALENIFNHPNTGPYLCRQLIQRLVSSEPSPGYVGRVVAKFEDDGTPQHVRGNLRAVLQAILLDGEARKLSAASATVGGKQREPILRITGPARTFPAAGYEGTYSQSGDLVLTLTTTTTTNNVTAPTPHRLAAGDSVTLDFTGNLTSTSPPKPLETPSSIGAYTVVAAPTASTFTVNAAGLASYSYTQAAGASTIILTASGLEKNEAAYLAFPAGGPTSGRYLVSSVPDTTHLAFTWADAASAPAAPATARSGKALVPRLSGAYVAKVGPPSTLAVTSYTSHHLSAGDQVSAHLATGVSAQLTSTIWTVASVQDEYHFTVASSTDLTAETVSVTLYPLVAPPLTRSGKFRVAGSKFDMGSTDSPLSQTPLNAPTVFNFFYPDYQFPGQLAAANATTPEFQLTTDTNIINLTNAVDNMLLLATNPNGLSSFSNGAIMLDLSALAQRSPDVTTVAGVTSLVEYLNDLLTGGTMSTESKAKVVAFVASTTFFPSASATNARDRVRAAVQLILASPEYAIQR